MLIGAGEHHYAWIDNWGTYPDTESARRGWSHSGVVVARNGDVLTFHPGEPQVVAFGPDGNVRRTLAVDVTNAHGMALTEERGTEYLWLADNGAVRPAAMSYQNQPAPRGPQVVKTTLDGHTVLSLAPPDIAVYREGGRYSPTSVAVFEERFGGNGDVWVADGYGASYVHRYDKLGRYVASINGEEGAAGVFKTPHAVFVDRRRREPELYVADRSNSRVQVYDLEGTFKRAFGTGIFTTPSDFATDSDIMIVAELRARLALLDAEDRLIGYLGANEPVCSVPGWPNNRDEAGNPIRTPYLEAGKFNSPHGMAVDPAGNIYVAEWLIGGRFTKLARR